MGWNRSASILSAVVFVAFGFMVIGVFSDPLSSDMLSIGSKDNYSYGISGYCSIDGNSVASSDSKDDDDVYKHATSQCSDYSLGYKSQGDSWPGGAETVTKAFIVHFIAAGLLLISFIMTLLSHFRNAGFWVTVAVFLFLSCVASAVAFAVELYVFKTNMAFAGWFGLPAAILSLFAGISMTIMHRQLKAKLGRTSVGAGGTGKDAFLNDAVAYQGDNSFNFGREEDKLLKSRANVSTYPITETHMNRMAGRMANSPSFNSSSQPKGYQKIPENKSTTSSATIHSRVHPLPLPFSQSTESIGAIGRKDDHFPLSDQRSQRNVQPNYRGNQTSNAYSSSGQRDGYGRQAPPAAPGGNGGQYNPNLPRMANDSRSANIANNSVPRLANNAGMGGSMGSSAAYNTTASALGGAAAAAGAVGAAGMSVGRDRNDLRQPNIPRSQREETWSQVASKKVQGGKARESNASIATTEAPHVPAGQFSNGVDKTERYGPNVVQIPKFRKGEAPAAESAIIEYHKDETQSRSPVSKSRIPNYSRMSAQGGGSISPSGKSRNKNLTGPTHAKKPSSESETSYYSERIPAAPSMNAINKATQHLAQGETAEPKKATKAAPDNTLSQYDQNAYMQQQQQQQQQPQPQQYSQEHYTQNQKDQPQQQPQQQQPQEYSQQESYSQTQQDPSQQQRPQQTQEAQDAQQYQYQYAPTMGADQQQYAYNQYSGNPNYYGYDYSQAYGYGNYAGYDQMGYNNNTTYQAYSQPMYAPNYYNQYAAAPGASHSAPAPRQKRSPKKPQASDIALMSNPDFSVGELGKRRPNRRL